jgi:nitroimidazol reductase NimA-like FMN-containing flavoprotein (pyridoxamine 5'-phosphate oxidase superfamily)
MVFQMPPLSTDEVDEFLVKAPIATLCTQNTDGTIHAAPLFFKYDQGELLFGTQNDARRIKNIKNNPNVTIVIDDEHPPFKGVVLYGKAKLDYDDVIPKRVAIFEKYMPKPNAEKLANGLAAMRKPVVIRVKPSKVTSYDYAKDPTGLFK